MHDKARKLLIDISAAIQHIEDFTSDKQSFFDYQDDLKTKSAVERQLAIIGEAASKLSQLETEISLAKAREMISFRNRLIHAYDSIDDTIVWAILKSHLPVLKEEISHLLS